LKRLLLDLDREHPGVKASLLKSLGNVMPRHLLDRRLHPVRPAGRRQPSAPAETTAPNAAWDTDTASAAEDDAHAATGPGAPAPSIIPLRVLAATTPQGRATD
jgi:hypothetical protein